MKDGEIYENLRRNSEIGANIKNKTAHANLDNGNHIPIQNTIE